jgi:membrane-bound serine protease (ClpP class)
MELLWADSFGAASWLAPWAWAILLLMVGFGLAVMEVFIPSGGILGFLAICSVIAAITVGFMDGRTWVGFGILTAAVFGVPAAVILALRWWPKTPLGRRMLLRVPSDADVLPDGPRQQKLKQLVGRIGVAKSKMLPSGLVAVDGRKVDAVTEGMPIDMGTRVRVLQVHGNRVVVRPVDGESDGGDESDTLSRPIDALGGDPFEDPLVDNDPPGG